MFSYVPDYKVEILRKYISIMLKLCNKEKNSISNYTSWMTRNYDSSHNVNCKPMPSTNLRMWKYCEIHIPISTTTSQRIHKWLLASYIYFRKLSLFKDASTGKSSVFYRGLLTNQTWQSISIGVKEKEG